MLIEGVRYCLRYCLRYCKDGIDVDWGGKILFQMFSWQVFPHRAHPKIICHARRKPFLQYTLFMIRIYLSKSQKVFVQINKYIYIDCKMYFIRLHSKKTLVVIKLYSYKLNSIFFWNTKYICLYQKCIFPNC